MLPWDQLASLGAGGMVAVAILWIVFGFLSKRGNNSDKVINILEQQTRILEDLHRTNSDTRDRVIMVQSKLECNAAHQ